MNETTPLTEAAAPDNVANASKNDKYLAFEWLRAQDCFYAAILGHELSRLKSLENAALREQLQGRVVVPEEPTHAMLYAAGVAPKDEIPALPGEPEYVPVVKMIYRAMLLAAAKETKNV